MPGEISLKPIVVLNTSSPPPHVESSSKQDRIRWASNDITYLRYPSFLSSASGLLPAESELSDVGPGLDLPSMAELFGEEPLEPASAALRATSPVPPEVDFLKSKDPPEEEKEEEAPTANRRFITLTWAEPLPNRKEANLRMAAMRAVARLRASGVPVLRWHADRAKEFMSQRLSDWLKASQGIHETKTAPEDHAASGRAEVAVREMKRGARRCLLALQQPSSLWPLAIRHTSEQSWRRTMTRLGAPMRPSLAFGTKVQARNREWKRRDDKAWGPRTISRYLVGPAPHTASAYVARLADGRLYISSSAYPVAVSSPDEPKHRHSKTSPLGLMRVLMVPDGGGLGYGFQGCKFGSRVQSA